MDKYILRVDRQILQVDRRVLRVNRRAPRMEKRVLRVLRVSGKYYDSSDKFCKYYEWRGEFCEKSYPVITFCLMVESKITIYFLKTSFRKSLFAITALAYSAKTLHL